MLVGSDFHTRFSTHYRHYQYLLWVPKNKSISDSLFGDFIVNQKRIRYRIMNEAAKYLLGENDLVL